MGEGMEGSPYATRIFQAASPRRNATFCYSSEHIARGTEPRARERSINDRAMNAQIAVDRVRRAIPRKIDHFSGNPGAPRRVAPRDSFRLRSGFGPVSAGGGRRLRRVFPSFFHHPRDKARLVPDLRAANQYLADATPRDSRARERVHVRRAHRRSIFRIVRRIPVVSGRDVKLPGG